MATQADVQAAGRIRPVSARTSLDRWTVLGISGGLALLLSAITINGSLRSFFDVPSIMIVVLGTFFLTGACYSGADLSSTRRFIGNAIRRTSVRPDRVALQILEIAELSRQKGVLSIQHSLSSLGSQPMLQRGLGMAVDGVLPEEIDRVLKLEVSASREQRMNSVEVVRKAADLAPAMGLIGTLIGLIQMLANLDDPSTIGPAMAVALVTTFYGACLANIVFIPLSTKMERNAQHDDVIEKIYLQGVVSISRKENPRRLEMLLNTILPPQARISYFD